MKQPDFSIVKKHVEETTADASDLLYCLLSGIVEERIEIIEEHLPKVIKDMME